MHSVTQGARHLARMSMLTDQHLTGERCLARVSLEPLPDARACNGVLGHKWSYQSDLLPHAFLVMDTRPVAESHAGDGSQRKP